MIQIVITTRERKDLDGSPFESTLVLFDPLNDATETELAVGESLSSIFRDILSESGVSQEEEE